MLTERSLLSYPTSSIAVSLFSFLNKVAIHRRNPDDIIGVHFGKKSHSERLIENAEGYVLIAVYFFILILFFVCVLFASQKKL